LLEFAGADRAGERRGQTTATVEIGLKEGHRGRPAALAAGDNSRAVVSKGQVIELFQAVWGSIRDRNSLGVQQPEHEQEHGVTHGVHTDYKRIVAHRTLGLKRRGKYPDLGICLELDS